MVVETFSLIYYWIKHFIKPVKLPMYEWQDNVVTFSNIRNEDNQAKIKFYATKNWVEIYIKESANVDYSDSNLNSRDNRTESFIIPRWRITDYRPYELPSEDTTHVLEFIGVTYDDYERYTEWHK